LDETPSDFFESAARQCNNGSGRSKPTVRLGEDLELEVDILDASLHFDTLFVTPAGDASESALETALAVFAEEGISLEADAPRHDALEALMDRGRDLQGALHAERRHEGHAAPDNPATGSIYPLVVQYCYGEIWDRPGLDRRLRALCAVASFAALDHDILLRKFILSALNIGASRNDIIEALIQGGPYNGFAFMLKALNIAQEAFATLDQA
jgi:4-carboxymuconolactone decarboxylase